MLNNITEEAVVWPRTHLPNAAIALDKGCSRQEEAVAAGCHNRQQQVSYAAQLRSTASTEKSSVQ